MVYSGRAKNCNLGHAICSEPQASSENKEEEPSFIEKGELEGAVINKEAIGGNWKF